MVGVELKAKVAPYLSGMQERAVLAFAAGLTVIRLLPPLVITQAELDTVIEALRSAIAEPIPEAAEP